MKLGQEKIPSITTVHSTIGSQRLGTKKSSVPLERLERSERMTYALLPFLSNAEKFYLKRSANLIFVSEYIRNWCIDKRQIGQESEVSQWASIPKFFQRKNMKKQLYIFHSWRIKRISFSFLAE